MKSVFIGLMICVPAAALFAQNKNEDTPKPTQSIAELRGQLEKILQDSHTPGVSVAIVHRDGPEWLPGSANPMWLRLRLQRTKLYSASVRPLKPSPRFPSSRW